MNDPCRGWKRCDPQKRGCAGTERTPVRAGDRSCAMPSACPARATRSQAPKHRLRPPAPRRSSAMRQSAAQTRAAPWRSAHLHSLQPSSSRPATPDARAAPMSRLPLTEPSGRSQRRVRSAPAPRVVRTAFCEREDERPIAEISRGPALAAARAARSAARRPDASRRKRRSTRRSKGQAPRRSGSRVNSGEITGLTLR